MTTSSSSSTTVPTQQAEEDISNKSWFDVTESEEQERKKKEEGNDGQLEQSISQLTVGDSGSNAATQAAFGVTGRLMPFGDKLTDFGAEIEKMQADPNNPLYSEVQSFEELKLRKELIEGLYVMGYKQPSNIQGKSLPIILNTQDNLIAQSQSGTGKTACFALGMLSAVDVSKKMTQALCICNSLELAQQIYTTVKEMAQKTKVTVGTVMKGLKPGAKITDHVIIGTPGKVEDMLQRRRIDPKNIRVFVLDEADQMLENENLRTQSIKIKRRLPKDCRVLLFSATYTEEDPKMESDEDRAKEMQILEFADKIVPEPRKLILVPREKLTLEYMRQYYVMVNGDSEKLSLMKEIYEDLNIGQSIIFVNRVDTAEKIKRQLEQDGFPCSLLHGRLEVDERKRVMSEFREVKSKVLISTNVIARGLDISSVTHVVNYDLPLTKEGHPDYANYLHRIGRTARFGRKGVAINICASPHDHNVIEEFNRYFKISITPVDKDEIDEKVK